MSGWDRGTCLESHRGDERDVCREFPSPYRKIDSHDKIGLAGFIKLKGIGAAIQHTYGIVKQSYMLMRPSDAGARIKKHLGAGK